MEPSVSPELEEESIIIVYAGLETGLYATNMERGGELRVFELPGRAFIFGFIEERYYFIFRMTSPSRIFICGLLPQT